MLIFKLKKCAAIGGIHKLAYSEIVSAGWTRQSQTSLKDRVRIEHDSLLAAKLRTEYGSVR